MVKASLGGAAASHVSRMVPPGAQKATLLDAPSSSSSLNSSGDGSDGLGDHEQFIEEIIHVRPRGPRLTRTSSIPNATFGVDLDGGPSVASLASRRGSLANILRPDTAGSVDFAVEPDEQFVVTEIASPHPRRVPAPSSARMERFNSSPMVFDGQDSFIISPIESPLRKTAARNAAARTSDSPSRRPRRKSLSLRRASFSRTVDSPSAPSRGMTPHSPRVRPVTGDRVDATTTETSELASSSAADSSSAISLDSPRPVATLSDFESASASGSESGSFSFTSDGPAMP
ncbi:uncharacterized protein AMSG_02657 [Thecamonas trahens ATCC 50062]|uniref:Uncharacterized protein n=1 Tax=Thecamonas trahens ATCC 50062 TaxID=461836 RepID=A0A0L0D625_THETB|nr:hypothetical protein AMSG_02657 [Thecamonas trahens ATCC 50062]KNC47635.1 hypothetical protein AMSG_02657 [Thecamonas trahens ATCC 50062]|eukprot:XP_013759555.1 hypothetical protein AMSG_02657 [Thecamonas trahens ATCC 50062]